MGIWYASKNTKTSNGRSTSTQPILFVSRHSNSTTYDRRRHTQEPRTSIVTPKTIITFRFCCKWVFEVPQKILEYLMDCLHQPILFYMCPGMVFQPQMSAGDTYRDLRQAYLHPTKLSLLESAVSGYFGSFKK